MKQLLLFFSFSMLQNVAFAQITFENIYGKAIEFGWSIKQTSDGGYIVGGSTGLNDNSDALLMKLDFAGKVVWSKSFGGNKSDAGSYVDQTSDGGYILVGSTISFGAGDSDIYLIKTDSNGNLLWTKTYGGSDSEAASYVAEINGGGYMVAGYTNSFGKGLGDYYLLKTDSNGNLIWSKTYGGAESEYIQNARLTSEGGCIMIGTTSSYVIGVFNTYVVKVDKNGNLKWAKSTSFGGGTFNADEGFGIVETFDGGYVFTSEPEYVVQANSGGDYALVKFDSLGNYVWNSPINF